MLTIHLRVTEAATGKATPVRLQISGPAGEVYFPFGTHHEFPVGRNEDVGGRVRIGRDAWVLIDGSCEIRLPAAVPLRVRIEKGPEFAAVDESVILGPGQMALRFAVERWSNVRESRWFPGDVRSHFLSPQLALLEAAAEDLAVANVLACETAVPSQDGQTYLTVSNLAAFSGESPALEKDGSLVAVGTLNSHPVLGSVGLLHTHRVVFPIRFGEPDYPDDWSVCDWCDQCHRKHGLAVWVDSCASGTGGEALLAAILGKLDAIEFDGRPRVSAFLPRLYDLWNAGLRIGLVGGSGKDSNRVPLGKVRTFAELGPGETLSFANWIEAVRAGRTYATTGPLLTLTVGPAGPGEAAELLEPGRLPIVAQAESRTAFERLELVANGEVVASAAPREKDGRWLAFLGFEHEPSASGWVAARVIGTAADSAFAHTSAVWVNVAGRPPSSRISRALTDSIASTRNWAETVARYTDPKWRLQLLANCDAAWRRLASARTSPPTGES